MADTHTHGQMRRGAAPYGRGREEGGGAGRGAIAATFHAVCAEAWPGGGGLQHSTLCARDAGAGAYTARPAAGPRPCPATSGAAGGGWLEYIGYI